MQSVNDAAFQGFPKRRTYLGPFLPTRKSSGTESSLRGSCLMKALSESLSSCVVLWRTNVYEHTVLLESIDPNFERAGKYVPFQTSRSLRNTFQHRAIKYVHAAVYQARSRIAAFLTKANHSILSAELNAPVSRRIRDSASCHTNQTTMCTMKPHELRKVDL